MEWLPIIVIAGIIVLVVGGTKFAPKIVGDTKQGIDAWSNEIKKATNKNDEASAE